MKKNKTNIPKPIGKNYIPDSIGFPEVALGLFRCDGKTVLMLADESKARQIIKAILETGAKISSAELGLDGDWRENSSVIYENGKFSKYDAYDGSFWATPILIINYEDRPSEAYECWSPAGKQ